MRWRRELPVIGACLFLAGPALAIEPTGIWNTERNEAQIQIAPCGNALCGHIVALREPRDPATGRPKVDGNNRDARLRRRPLLGLTIVTGMKPDGRPGRWSGQVYNPRDGGIYPAAMTMKGAGTLLLEGCLLKNMLCRGQTWARAK
jgi:uncharacterized protein (DUF2147 family)